VPELEAAEDEDEEENRVRIEECEDDERGHPTSPERRMDCGDRAAAVERHHGQKVEEVEEEAREGKGDE
jgi:hypothetical protein